MARKYSLCFVDDDEHELNRFKQRLRANSMWGSEPILERLRLT